MSCSGLRPATGFPQELRRRQASLRSVRLGLGRQQTRLLEAYLAGVIDLTTFGHKRGELRQHEEDVLAREREVVAQGQRLVAVESLARSTTQLLEQLSRGLEQATFEQRRQLVELLVDRVVVTDDAAEIRYAIPTSDASTHTRCCQLRSDYFDCEAPQIPAPQCAQVSRQWTADPGEPHAWGARRKVVAAERAPRDHHPMWRVDLQVFATDRNALISTARSGIVNYTAVLADARCACA